MTLTNHFGGQSTSLQAVLWLNVLLYPTKCLGVTGPGVIHAVEPSCITDAAGSTSCNVGINPVATYGTIDGGYQWLTPEVTATTISGELSTETIHVFTATETDFLGIVSATTNNDGMPSTMVTTQYVSFITATPTVNGAAAGAVIAGIVIAPALIASVQTVTDAAAGKTVGQIADELSKTFGQKATLTPGDLQGLANYVLNAVILAAGAKAIVSAYWTGATAPLGATNTNTETSSSSTMSSSSANGGAGGASDAGITASALGPEITAIMKPPYDNWAVIRAMADSGPKLDFPETDGSPQPKCASNPLDMDVAVVNQLGTAFCVDSSVDFSKNALKVLAGSDLNPNVDTKNLAIKFEYNHDSGQCQLNCTESYQGMINSCKTKTGTINGAASLTDECGMYAMTVAIKPDPAPAPPAPPSGPRPLFAQICSPRGNGVLPFTRDQALDALTRYCPSEYIIPDKGKTYNFSQVEGTVSIEGSFGWSKAGQDGCNAMTSNKFSQTDCKNLFMAAVDNCDTDTASEKYGAKPMTWSGPNGCMDFTIWATWRH